MLSIHFVSNLSDNTPPFWNSYLPLLGICDSAHLTLSSFFWPPRLPAFCPSKRMFLMVRSSEILSPSSKSSMISSPVQVLKIPWRYHTFVSYLALLPLNPILSCYFTNAPGHHCSGGDGNVLCPQCPTPWATEQPEMSPVWLRNWLFNFVNFNNTYFNLNSQPVASDYLIGQCDSGAFFFKQRFIWNTAV